MTSPFVLSAFRCRLTVRRHRRVPVLQRRACAAPGHQTLCCDDSTVDDVFQDVSIKVLRRIHTVRDARTMRGWLFQTAHNACLDFLRACDRRPTTHPVADEMATSDQPGPLPAERLCTTERIEAFMQRLTRCPKPA